MTHDQRTGQLIAEAEARLIPILAVEIAFAAALILIAAML